jgi:hypothetical protein
MIQNVSLLARFSEETDAGTSGLVDTNPNPPVVEEFPLSAVGLFAGDRIIRLSAAGSEYDPKQTNCHPPGKSRVLKRGRVHSLALG